MNNTAIAIEPAIIEAPQSAAARLQAIEAEAAPLRARAAEIDALLADLGSPKQTIEDEVAARKQANELSIERGVIAERLQPLETQAGALRIEAKIEAKREARAQLEANILEAVKGVRVFAEDYLYNAEILRDQIEAGHRDGHFQSVTMQTALKELVAVAAKANKLISYGIR